MEDGTEGNAGGEEKEFDFNAFAGEDAPKAATQESTSVGSDEDKDFSWGDQDDAPKGTEEEDAAKLEAEQKAAADAAAEGGSESDGEGETEEQRAEAERVRQEQEAAAVENPDDKNPLSDDNFSSFAEELGLSATNKEEFMTQLQELEAENKRLKEGQGSNVQNEKIGRLNDLKKKTNDELVRLDLKKQGLDEAEVDEAMDIYTDNGTVNLEALKIKKSIDRAITNEQNEVTQSAKTEEATLLKEQQESVAALTKHINGEETKFGFQMAKDAESLKQVREGHTKYITSGEFYNDITSDSKNLSDAAWLWKNKDVIMKSLGSKGIQQGRKEVLDDIGKPEVSDTKRFSSPTDKGEFDAGAFLSGN